MQTAVLNKVREYRWELWLFFGMPILAWAATLLGYEIVEAFHGERHESFGIIGWLGTGLTAWCTVLLGPMIAATLVAVLYWWVDRLERPVLRTVWLYILLASVLDIGQSAAAFAVIVDRVTEVSISDSMLYSYTELDFKVYTYMELALLVVQIGLLVWFSRGVSRSGFDKALVLIAVSVFLPSTVAHSVNNVFRFGVHYMSSNIVMVLAVIVLTIVAAWALQRADSEKSIQAKGFATLFGAALLSLIAFQVLLAGGPWIVGWKNAVLSASIQTSIYAVAIGAAYAIRVRPPRKDSPTEEHPAEEPIDRTTLLYGGSWRDSL